MQLTGSVSRKNTAEAATQFLIKRRSIPKGFARGAGSRCWDLAGHEYIDYVLGYGTLILGHAHPAVNEAVCRRLSEGTIFPYSHPLSEQLAAELKAIFPYAGEVIFQKTGSAATSTAVRIARAYTGRDKIIRAGYHGWHDWAADSVLNEYPLDYRPGKWKAGSPGVPQVVSGLTIRIDCNDLESIERLLKQVGDQVACIIIAPEEVLPPIKDKLTRIQELAKHYGIVLIFDEIKTAFRIALGGVQEYYGIFPDMTTISKAMANGFPISAVVGTPEVMQVVDKILVGNTYQEELGAIAAALATIEIVKREKVIEHLWYVGNRLIDGINVILTELGLDAFIKACGWPLAPMPFIYFRNTLDNRASLRKAFFNRLAELGILMYSDNHPNFTSLAHSDRDIELTLEACRIAFDSIREFIDYN